MSHPQGRLPVLIAGARFGLLLLFATMYGGLGFVWSSGPLLAYATDSTILRCTNVFNERVIEPGNAVPSRWNVTVSPCIIGYSSEGMFGVTVTPYQAQQKLPGFSSTEAWSISPSIISLGDLPVGAGGVAEFSVNVPATTPAGIYVQSFKVNYTDAGGSLRWENDSGSIKVSTIADVSTLSLALGFLPETGDPELLAARLTTVDGVPVANALVEVCGESFVSGPSWLSREYLATDSAGIATLPLEEMGRHRTAVAMYSNSTVGCGSLGVLGNTTDYVSISIALPRPKFPLFPLASVMLPALLLQGLGVFAIRKRIPRIPPSVRRLSPIMPTALGLLGGAAGILMLLLIHPYPIPERPFVCTSCVPAPVTAAALGSALCISGAVLALFFRKTGALLLLLGGLLPAYGVALGESIYPTGYGWYLLWVVLPISGGLFALRKFLAQPFTSIGDEGPKHIATVAGLWGLAGFSIVWFGLIMGGAYGQVPSYAEAYALGWVLCSLIAIFVGSLTRISMRASALTLVAAFNAMLGVTVLYWYDLSTLGALPKLSITISVVFALWYGWIPLILVAGMLGLSRCPRGNP